MFGRCGVPYLDRPVEVASVREFGDRSIGTSSRGQTTAKLQTMYFD